MHWFCIVRHAETRFARCCGLRRLARRIQADRSSIRIPVLKGMRKERLLSERNASQLFDSEHPTGKHVRVRYDAQLAPHIEAVSLDKCLQAETVSREPPSIPHPNNSSHTSKLDRAHPVVKLEQSPILRPVSVRSDRGRYSVTSIKKGSKRKTNRARG